MKTQDTDTLGAQMTPRPPARSSVKRWVGGIGALIVVILIVGLSAVVFAQLASHRGGRVTSTTATNKWEQALKGYTIISLEAANSNPSVLYACASSQQVYTPLPGVPPNRIKSGNNPTVTVLRSTDFGNHWQDVGSKEGFNGSCQLAVNPSDSNEIYAIGALSNTQTNTLKHSTDGGKTWETMQPVLQTAATDVQPTPAWHVTHLTFVGKHLFALQWIPQRLIPETGQEVIPQANLFSHLITSVDGGHTWVVIDNQFNTPRLGARDYAVNSSNPNIIYEVVGRSWFPPIVSPPGRVPQGQDVQPAFVANEELYKTVDGGATWHQLLGGLPFNSQVRLAIDKPEVIYVGSSFSPLPYILQPQGAESPGYTRSSSAFQLRMSSDGGANWQQVPALPGQLGVLNWFVSADGKVYISPIMYSGNPTAVKGTATIATRVTLPPTTPKTGQTGGYASQNVIPASTGSVPNATGNVILPQSVQQYDPATGKWSEVTQTPTYGRLVAVTPAPVNANGGAVLWLQGSVNGAQVLYRYVV